MKTTGDSTFSPLRKAGRAGFTLIELMIVIVCIGLLTSIAVPVYSKARNSSRIRQAEADLQIISAGILQLAYDTGLWPGRLARNSTHNPELWDLSVARAGLIATDGLFPNWQGPYVPSIPRDPWGANYFFDPDYTAGSRVRVVVGSFGPNGNGRNIYDSDNIFVLLDR